MARKRSRSPFPVTQPPFHPSFLSPLRRSIRSFPLLGGVSRRCNLRLNCQSTGYYFPVSLPGRSGRLGAARWPLQEKTERVPWRKLARGGGRGYIDPCVFFVKSEGWVSRVLDITIDETFFVFQKVEQREIRDILQSQILLIAKSWWFFDRLCIISSVESKDFGTCRTRSGQNLFLGIVSMTYSRSID